MPTYEYKCSNGHRFEAVQSMADDPITECEVCGAPVERVFSPIAVHFKGSGFYTTDYGSKKKSAGSEREATSGGKEEKSSKPEGKEPAKAKSDGGGSGSGGSSSSSSD